MPSDNSERRHMDAEEYANAKIRMDMNVEQYALVTSIILAHLEENPEDAKVLGTLEGIRIQ